MKKLTIRLSDEEHAVVVKIATLRGILPEELALDGVRCLVDTDLEMDVNVLLDRGMDRPQPVLGATA